MWRAVHCPLSPRTSDISIQVFFVLGAGEERMVKAKNSQVSGMLPKEFPIAPHFYPICFGKCCPPLWAKRKELYKLNILNSKDLMISMGKNKCILKLSVK
jgi:hypothetical protein